MFLAATSSSRSDVVTQFVFSCFRPLFFLLVSLESVVVWNVISNQRVSKGFNGSQCVFQGCFKKVSRMFQGSFKEVSTVFQLSLKGVSWN